jgi:hypothetical protein
VLQLAAQIKLLDQFTIGNDVIPLEVVEKLPPLPDEPYEPVTRMEVSLVIMHVKSELIDPLGQKRDLNLRGARVLVV